ncbi:hypothetical protein StoSoilA2_20930 [Arthrobacter sp. StoSoilA2]|nr:hypothetical protein StoSoilA2_20930 [Arthrobacter sp. StoSoilA2]
MYSVEFVLNDYVQLRFDGDAKASGPIVLNSYVWPVVDQPVVHGVSRKSAGHQLVTCPT